MREAWRELMFAAVAPTKRSEAAEIKATSRRLRDGTPTHSFSTLLDELGTIVRNTCRTPNTGSDAPTFDVTTISNPKQQRAFELIKSERKTSLSAQEIAKSEKFASDQQEL